MEMRRFSLIDNIVGLIREGTISMGILTGLAMNLRIPFDLFYIARISMVSDVSYFVGCKQ